MIKNERQYRITKARVEEFEDAMASSAPASPKAGEPPIDPALLELERSATSGQLDTMREEVAEYESLLSGIHKVLEVDSFEDLPRALIQARIAARMSHRELAEKLALKEQQVQRYEATDYAAASLTTIARVIDALGLRVRKDVFLPSADLTLKGLWHRLKDVGLPRELVVGRMLSRRLSAEVQDAGPGGNAALSLRIAATIGRIFGIAPAAFFDDRPLQFAGAASSLARFKVSAAAEITRLNAYTVYAHYLAMTALGVAIKSPHRKLPETPAAFRKAVTEAYGSITFQNTVSFAWDCGIIVLPLNDAGAFHGACWRINGRHVVVLKQKNQSVARWFFDLLHELRHTLQEDQDPEFSVIEAEETSQERRESVFEQDADAFAANFLLNGNAKDLAKRCVELAGGSVERLKGVVPKIARESRVDVGALANYMAFRLARQGTADWWGAAANLQPCDRNPWQDARDVFLERVNLNLVNPADRELLLRALSDPGEVQS